MFNSGSTKSFLPLAIRIFNVLVAAAKAASSWSFGVQFDPIWPLDSLKVFQSKSSQEPFLRYMRKDWSWVWHSIKHWVVANCTKIIEIIISKEGAGRIEETSVNKVQVREGKKSYGMVTSKKDHFYLSRSIHPFLTVYIKGRIKVYQSIFHTKSVGRGKSSIMSFFFC